jgi:RNA polymerase sigma-70 factor (ECF subfamily)
MSAFGLREPEAELDESLLVSQIAAGEQDLFRLLVSRYQREVHAMGLSFFHNREDAADFTQDVFIKAYGNLGRFRGSARFSTWLYRIAYNTAVNGITRRKEYRSLAEEDAPRDERTPEGLTIREAARTAVQNAVAELPEKYRICVDLFFFYDRSLREIGEITGIPENTVKSHVFRAKKLLRKELEGFK